MKKLIDKAKLASKTKDYCSYESKLFFILIKFIKLGYR